MELRYAFWSRRSQLPGRRHPTPRGRDQPVFLARLDPELALRALLAVDPESEAVANDDQNEDHGKLRSTHAAKSPRASARNKSYRSWSSPSIAASESIASSSHSLLSVSSQAVSPGHCEKSTLMDMRPGYRQIGGSRHT